ncbi:uncharacterized protein ACHE_41135A [Aspergillus chevalieri]|uniref:Uncharacterized protein n=1 Tax=Aspergillus chevalieri TaxID=182096 RepID=A0A7R7VPU9_ASPCH|nr:uncharacterized protein ACHE_41135A [Aspergillus chevalieri]BCR88571.1 hypothetical protein ACHE_41135A [Aspergillus chevalieri]
MGAESLTALRADNDYNYAYSNYYPSGSRHDHRGSFQNIDDSNNKTCYNNSNGSSESWSLKRLLSRHGKRRYRVLEREPNRLRKRGT